MVLHGYQLNKLGFSVRLIKLVDHILICRCVANIASVNVILIFQRRFAVDCTEVFEAEFFIVRISKIKILQIGMKGVRALRLACIIPNLIEGVYVFLTGYKLLVRRNKLIVKISEIHSS